MTNTYMHGLVVTILEHLTPLHGSTDAPTISFVKSKLAELQAWHQEWYCIHKRRYDDESVVVKLLETERVYAELWTVCMALRGCSWDKVSEIGCCISEKKLIKPRCSYRMNKRN